MIPSLVISICILRSLLAVRVCYSVTYQNTYLEVHIMTCYVCKEKRPGFKELLTEQYAHQLCIIHQAEAGPQFIMSAGGNRGLTAELDLIITIDPFNI